MIVPDDITLITVRSNGALVEAQYMVQVERTFDRLQPWNSETAKYGPMDVDQVVRTLHDLAERWAHGPHEDSFPF